MRRAGAALSRRVLSRRVLVAAPLSQASQAPQTAQAASFDSAAARRGLTSNAGGWHRHQGEPSAAASWAEGCGCSDFSYHAVEGGVPCLYSLHASEWQQQHYLLSAAAAAAEAQAEKDAGVGDRLAPIEVGASTFPCF